MSSLFKIHNCRLLTLHSKFKFDSFFKISHMMFNMLRTPSVSGTQAKIFRSQPRGFQAYFTCAKQTKITTLTYIFSPCQCMARVHESTSRHEHVGWTPKHAPCGVQCKKWMQKQGGKENVDTSWYFCFFCAQSTLVDS